jgi:hypothetical protein
MPVGTACLCDEVWKQLRTQCRLLIKPGSKKVPPALRATSLELPGVDWQLRSSMPVLGHVLQNNAGVRECWRNTKSAMWSGLYAKCMTKQAKSLALACRLALTKKAVELVF